MDKKSRELVMAKLYFKNKDYKMAEKCFNDYLEMNPTDANATKLLAQVYEQNKRFDKAFEMYERCYLAEPDRTGVLLDICRILLMNEIWLDNVDYRKWLNLAIKAFPSNPIVVNLKACLTTLPPDETPQAAKEEDYLGRIFEKLCSLESRLEKIEEKLISHPDPTPAPAPASTPISVRTPTNIRTPTQAPALTQTLAPASVPTPTPTPLPASTPAPAPTLTPTPTLAQAANSVPSPAQPLFSALPQANSPAPATSLFSSLTKVTSPASGPTLFSTPISSAPPVSAPAPTLFSTLTQANSSAPSSTPVAAPAPTLFSSLTKATSPAQGSTPAAAPAPTLFSSMTQATSPANKSSPAQNPFSFSMKPSVFGGNTDFNFSNSVNLFEKSLQKFNVPTTFSKPDEEKKPFEDKKDNKDGKSNSEQKANIDAKAREDEKANEDGEEENELAPNEELAIENTCDMEPIEIKTGEENEDLVFEHRCKLFRLRDKEYKERGLGSIKVLKHKTTGKGRLIMRREAIGLVCLNCWNCTKIERVRDTQIRWLGLDASDGDPEASIFLVKFKTQELTDKFMSHLTALFSEDDSTPNTSVSSPQVSKTPTSNSDKDKSEVETKNGFS